MSQADVKDSYRNYSVMDTGGTLFLDIGGPCDSFMTEEDRVKYLGDKTRGNVDEIINEKKG